jgi:hypothetical protein
VNYANDRESLRSSFCEVGDGDGFDILRRESMQIKRVGYLDLDRFGEWIVVWFVDDDSWFVVRGSWFDNIIEFQLLASIATNHEPRTINYFPFAC